MSRIHPTALVDSGAEIGDDVEVGAYSVIGPNVVIGPRTRVMAHVFIDGLTTIGSGCTVFPFACVGTQTQDLKYKGGRTFVAVGDGTVLREYVTVHSSTEDGHTTKIGRNCLIMAYCHVAHECTIGDGVIMSNCSQLAGHVTVEDMATVGGMVGVHQFVRVGGLSFIGGLSRIAQDVPPYFLIEGNPPQAHGLNSVALKRRDIPLEARETLREAYRILYRENLSTRQAVDRMRQELKPCAELAHLISFVEASERGIIK